MKILKKQTVARVLLGCGLALGFLFGSGEARAYNAHEHVRLGDKAYQILNLMRRGQHLPQLVREQGVEVTPLTTRPPCANDSKPTSTCVPAAEQKRWERFVAEAIAAPAKLEKLRVGLDNPVRDAADCGGRYPTLQTPLHPTSPPEPPQLKDCRLGEMTFSPAREWMKDKEGGRCYFRKGYHYGGEEVADFYQQVPSTMAGAVLGFHAERPDDEVKDSTLTIRATNTLFYSHVKELADDVIEAGIVILAAPVVCLADIFFDVPGNCIEETIKAASDFDAVAQIDSMLPLNAGAVDGNWFGSLTGLWHHIHIDNEGEYNKTEGLHFWRGGPRTFGLDASDLAVVVLGDLIGATLNPDSSNGVSKYAPLADKKKRRRADWMKKTLGHLEFEPLDNLALYGWNAFKDSQSASDLGYAIHALGDAVQPHHTISAVGWGHGEWEQFAEDVWPKIFHRGDPKHYKDLSASLVPAYELWKFIDDFQTKSGTKDVPVREIIERVARQTAENPWATVGNVFKSTPDQEEYKDMDDAAHELLVDGLGATVAFLVKAAGSFEPFGFESPCACLPGQAMLGMDARGKLVNSTECIFCGKGVFADLPRWLDGQCVAGCPADKPFLKSGKCLATCSGTGCSGTACPPETPFVDNGTCRQKCPEGAVVVNNRECASSCPAGQIAEKGTFCRKPEDQPNPACKADPGIDGCCLARTAECTRDDQCCSGGCHKIDGVCLGGPGDACKLPVDCISQNCDGGTCGKANNGGGCKVDDDCKFGVCSFGICKFKLGLVCLKPVDLCDKGQCTCSVDPSEIKLCTCQCAPEGKTCGDNSECCSENCSAGKCTCKADAQACAGDAQCCSGFCGDDNKCQSTCKRSGQACSDSSPCCSDATCSAGGTCCTDLGKDCTANSQCCSSGCFAGKCVVIQPT